MHGCWAVRVPLMPVWPDNSIFIKIPFGVVIIDRGFLECIHATVPKIIKKIALSTRRSSRPRGNVRNPASAVFKCRALPLQFFRNLLTRNEFISTWNRCPRWIRRLRRWIIRQWEMKLFVQRLETNIAKKLNVNLDQEIYLNLQFSI